MTTNDINVAGGPTISDVNVCLNLTHTWDGDLDIFLQAPSGSTVELSTGNGGGGDYLFTVFDDQSPVPITLGVAPFPHAFAPEGLLSQVNGGPSDGLWQIQITDTVNADGGNLDYWSLGFNGAQDPMCNHSFPGGLPPTTPAFLGKQVGNISAAGEVDWYLLSTATGGAFSFDTSDTGNLPAGTFITDSELGLYDSSGNLIATDDDGGTGLFSLINEVLAPGDYYIAVGRFNTAYEPNWYVGSSSTQTGDYSLTIIPEPAGLGLLVLGGLALIRRRR